MPRNENMTFLQHLEELRWALLRILVLVIVVMVAGFFYSAEIQKIIMQPTVHLNLEFQDIKMTSPFTAKAVIALFTSLIICFPYIIFEIYSFIYPAISKVSKIYLFFIFIFSIIFFFIGCIFGYSFLLPVSISFFVRLVDDSVTFSPERLNYIFYSFWLILVCGLIYQLPIISLILTKLRILNYQFLKHMRSYAVVIFLILGAILSPPDPLSQLLLAAPLYILYELGILISYIFREKE